MNIQIKGVLYHSPDNIEIKQISINQDNYLITKLKLKSEYKKIVKYLKYLKQNNIIKSESKPRNKSIQKQLDNLINTKKIIKNSINAINTVF